MVGYLHPADHHPAKITKAEKDLARKLDFKDIKFPVKIRDIHKNKKHNFITISVLIVKIRKNTQSMYKNRCEKKNILLYLILGEKGKKHYVLIKDFNTFM